MRRTQLAQRVAQLVGPDTLQITDAQAGWPALGTLMMADEPLPVALFVGPIGLSQRSRDDVERRYQNPGADRPIVVPPGRLPLLLGVRENDPLVAVERPLLVSADPWHREGRTTRFSVFVNLAALRTAEQTGWAETTNAAGEPMRCFAPQLLPVSVLADRDGVTLSGDAVQIALDAAGLGIGVPPAPDVAAAVRARRATSSLVRDARFSRDVIAAYQGLCAMCGLDLDLVQGAHIYPAAAPGSSDATWNGLSLCANHHVAYDRHLVWVDPAEREVRLHPRILEQQAANSAVDAFALRTHAFLAEPIEPCARPHEEMFRMRYAHFDGQYAWAT